MRKIIIVVAGLLLLSACASQKLNEGLPRLAGMNVGYAIGYLGHPNSEEQIAGQKVYTWGHANTFTTTQTVRTPFSASGYGANGSTYYQGYTTSVVPQTYNFQCVIRLIADQNNIVRSWEWNGNEGGCDHYAGAMSRLIADTAQ